MTGGGDDGGGGGGGGNKRKCGQLHIEGSRGLMMAWCRRDGFRSRDMHERMKEHSGRAISLLLLPPPPPSDAHAMTASISSSQLSHVVTRSAPAQHATAQAAARMAVSLKWASHVTRHTSHDTRHTTHVTRHTSHVTHHASPHLIPLELENVCNCAHLMRGMKATVTEHGT